MATTKATALDYKKATIQDMIDYCKANNQVEWLKTAAADKPKFFELKKKFFEKFMPEAIPQKKNKTIYDKIAAL